MRLAGYEFPKWMGEGMVVLVVWFVWLFWLGGKEGRKREGLLAGVFVVFGCGDGAHELGHLEGGRSGFGTAVVLWVREATLAGLVGGVKEEDLVDDGESLVDLDYGEGVGDSGGDVLGVLGVALKDDGEAKDGVKGLGGVLRGGGEFGGKGGDFEGAGDAKGLELGFAQAGLLEGLFGGAEHAVDVACVVACGDDDASSVHGRSRRAFPG